ncbi:MAG: universal stress protein, partial [Planctomycetales bacterium]|nr:universal stress protein [Planctomycetales bacterium]
MAEPDPQELVVFSTLTNPNVAQIMRIALENAGIPCQVDGSFQAGLTGILGIRLLVPADHLFRARAVLDAQANQSLLARSRPMQIAIQRILVPTDFSPHGDCALAYGLNLAQQTGAALHLLHVIGSHEDLTQVQQHPDFTSDSLFVTEFLQQLEEGGDAAAAENPWADVPVTRSFRLGKPAQEICTYAGAEKIDLVVVGTHGHTGLARV